MKMINKRYVSIVLAGMMGIGVLARKRSESTTRMSDAFNLIFVAMEIKRSMTVQ